MTTQTSYYKEEVDSDRRRWESRLWTFFQIGLVSLVGYLTLQAVDTQRLLAQIITEARFMNVRLDKIETHIERSIDERYRSSDARRDFEAVSRALATIESQIRTIEAQDQHMANEIFDLQRRLGISNKARGEP